MKYKETCTQGSFTLRGAGFLFDYEAHNKILKIVPPDEERALARLKLDRHLSKDPLAYVESLDKTNQIKALMYSNNTTINLAEILDHDRTASLIKTTAMISRFAYDLNTKNFERFSSLFCQHFELKSLKIKKFSSRNKENEFFLGRIQTRYNNSICVRACTLTGLMAMLSDRTLRDLITMEFGNNCDTSAQGLLNVSSKLATISHILDENFVPERRLRRYKKLKNNINIEAITQKKSD